MSSIWADNFINQSFQKLQGDIETDVLIIGGGIAGILCAYFLKEKKMDYVLVEAKKIGHGITQNTTAKLTSQHGLIYDRLLRNVGLQKAKHYLMINQLAIEQFKELSQKIPCDFEEKPAYVYSVDNRSKIEKEVKAVNTLGMHAKWESELPIPVKIAGAIRFDHQAQFNPVKLLNGIVKDMNIYEDTFVRSIHDQVAVTKSGKINAKKIVIATHFPFINTRGCYFLKMYQHRSYVIALENVQNAEGMFVDEQDNGMSFRNYDNLLLIGGGDHRTGKQGGGWTELRHFAKHAYPNATERYAWVTQDCMTLDRVPYIGKYSKTSSGLYVATGFNKWGMTSSMASAMILSDMLMNKKNEYGDVFWPGRSMMKAQLVVNGLEAVKNLLYPSQKRCSHMGCSLKWNKEQHTWDCPCHGSRFDKKGNVIDNPAMEGIKIE